MTEQQKYSPDGGIWLSSNEVHELRDHIQALRVGHSLVSRADQLEPDEVREIFTQMGEAISQLAASSIFGSTNS